VGATKGDAVLANQNYLESLRRKHRQLSEEVEQMQRDRVDSLAITKLKRQKLPRLSCRKKSRLWNLMRTISI
jgi:hypothetical protein